MASISDLILDSLEDLVNDEFEKFKWYLTGNKAQDFKPIPRSRLENARKHSVVDQMVDQYGEPEATRITVQVFKRIGKSNLASELQRRLEAQVSGGQVQAGSVDGVGVASSSSQPGGGSLNVSADGRSSINAPVLSGGHFNGPVTINYTSTPI